MLSLLTNTQMIHSPNNKSASTAGREITLHTLSLRTSSAGSFCVSIKQSGQFGSVQLHTTTAKPESVYTAGTTINVGGVVPGDAVITTFPAVGKQQEIFISLDTL